jgi:hypothetical protein
MSPEFVQRLSDLSGVATVWLTAFAALSGCIFWYFSGITAKSKDDEFRRFKEESGVAMAKAKTEAARANERANEAALKLEELRRQVAPRQLNRDAFLKAIDGKPKAPTNLSGFKRRTVGRCFSSSDPFQ